jgi:hypothetical protein
MKTPKFSFSFFGCLFQILVVSKESSLDENAFPGYKKYVAGHMSNTNNHGRK